MFGERKFGIALSDATNLIAIPYIVYERCNTRKDIGVLYNIFSSNNAGSFIVGFPIQLNGQESVMCEKVLSFVNKIIKKYKVNIYLHDERYTTAMATRIAKEAKICRKKSQKIDDKVSAALILQQVLDIMKLYQ
ncbi:Holliday junction resolvase RuvX [Neoehrlichia mikurensis]|nr:Holliday junction resolvase RuvX [Neoehrlichia mikurensis]QXK93523.1 Holliday junction resolvase RuvX [Neoehrlichia mikurensis]